MHGKKTESPVRDAFLATLPVMAGYLVLGIGFGIILKSKGYGFFWALAMGVCIYAGSMQYLAIGLLTGGASLLTSALTTLAVNARHIFYGLSMIDRYKGLKEKPFLIFTLTDETYSLVCNGAPEKYRDCPGRYYFYVSLFDYVYWVTGCVAGSLLGSLLTFEVQGMDFALTALFLTVFVEQWLTNKDHLPAIAGVVISLISLLIFGADSFLIPAMLAITAVLTAMRKKEGRA